MWAILKILIFFMAALCAQGHFPSNARYVSKNLFNFFSPLRISQHGRNYRLCSESNIKSDQKYAFFILRSRRP